ncbi:uncharacterized protein KQ657_004098 [Scheffersomyces spartinae]|uniref:Rad21/Rec8-like protein N-terminal domain-containing protein n=1 Tax=Scheffersomyces spartinae TaxID=45513 RepID=A0A9P8AJP4_9ASCO|nr:uncharacterized protein KQ657_004098 [Scheffersomyces spartinae]KAG7194986.1 hypothetical protein KQ657_004098 [Scheffersomyces spartinae]
MENVWLLATIGSKSNGRKNFNKEILDTRIPNLCVRVIKYSDHTSIRFCANIMLGVAIAYRKQVEKVLDEVNFMRTRLSMGTNHSQEKQLLPVFQRRSPLLSGVDNEYEEHVIMKEYKGTSSLRNLDDDPEFNIERDLIPPFVGKSVQDPMAKKRKIEIEEYDKLIFPGLTKMTPVSSLSGMGAPSRQSTLLGFNVQPALEMGGVEDVVFELNDDGFLVLKDGESYDQSILDDVDLRTNTDLPNPQVFQEIREEELLSISNDTDFALVSNARTLDRDRAETLNQNPLSKIRFTNLQVDEDIVKIPSTVLTESHRIYELQMKEFQLSQTMTSRLVQLTSKATKEINFLFLGFTKYNNSSLLDSILRTLEERSKCQLAEDVEIEYGKRSQLPENILDELGILDFDSHYLQHPPLIAASSDIFDLEVGVLQHNYSTQSRSSSRGDPLHDIGFGLGIPTNIDEDIENLHSFNTGIGHTTTLFIQFLIQRANQLGEINYSCPYSLKILDDTHDTIISYTGSKFGYIEFTRLIPTKSSSNLLLEQPVTRTSAANGFASLLVLACKDLVHLESETSGNWWNPAIFTVVVPCP